jgi:hypothetical protein
MVTSSLASAPSPRASRGRDRLAAHGAGAITPWGYERLDQSDNYEGSTRGIADVRVVTAKAASVDPANALRGDAS